MINFLNDYSQIAHEAVISCLMAAGKTAFPGYGLDERSDKTAGMIKKLINRDADVHFMISGTSCNKTVIAHALRPYEAVIAVTSGHINVHETGAVEADGHKILTVKGVNGKILPAEILGILETHNNEHMVIPKMVYISNSTETGTIYRKAELEEIAQLCRERGLFLFLDGARLGVALTAAENDLSLADIARLTDVFYIGGTKNGALLGEALVITNDELKINFRYAMKQNGAMLAKGFIIGMQFEALFTHGLLFKLAGHANATAAKLAADLEERGIKPVYPVETNQVFISLPEAMARELAKKYLFETWEKSGDKLIIRLVTSWATEMAEIDQFLRDLDEYKK